MILCMKVVLPEPKDTFSQFDLHYCDRRKSEAADIPAMPTQTIATGDAAILKECFLRSAL